jgi:hypothetical protein
MSKAGKSRHNHKGESRQQSLRRRYESKKMTAVINHIEYERHHGFESARRGDSVPPVQAI